LAHEILHQRDYVLTPITLQIAAKMYHPLLSTMAEVRAEKFAETYFPKSKHEAFANPRISDGTSTNTLAAARTIFDNSLEDVDPAKRNIGMAFSYDSARIESDFPYSHLTTFPNALTLHHTFWDFKDEANALREKLLSFPYWDAAVNAGYLDVIKGFDKRALAYLLSIEKLERRPSAAANQDREL
jgi:hypothetical protein